MAESKFVVIATSTHDYEMHILKTFIEDHGVRAFLRDANEARGYYGVALGGVKLEVMREDVEVAQKLLHLYRQQTAKDDAMRGRLSAMPEAMHELMMVSPKSQVEAAPEPLQQAALARERTCPRCGHDGRMQDVAWSGAQILAIVLLLGVPLFFMKPKVECPECGERWHG